MKRKLLALSVIVMCVSILAHGTLAYFTAEKTAHNVITSGNIDIDLLEWANEEKTDPFPTGESVIGKDGIVPGEKVTKIVEVKNTGANDAYIRVKVDKSITLAEGVEGEVDLAYLLLDINEDYWTEQDGYYYYNAVLPKYNEANPEQSTTVPLFTTVTFAPEMGNMYQGSRAEIKIVAQAVQVANNPGENALTAEGWPNE